MFRIAVSTGDSFLETGLPWEPRMVLPAPPEALFLDVCCVIVDRPLDVKNWFVMHRCKGVDVSILQQLKDKIPPEGESVKAFAERAGVDKAKLYNLLNGHDVDITTKILGRIVKALNCEIIIKPRDK